MVACTARQRKIGEKKEKERERERDGERERWREREREKQTAGESERADQPHTRAHTCAALLNPKLQTKPKDTHT
jgi:hypothetical protein